MWIPAICRGNRPVDLKALVCRYKIDTRLLNEHPEYTEERKNLLRKRIERHKNDIVDYVTSKSFETVLNNLNL